MTFELPRELFQTLVTIEGESSLYRMDTFKREGKLWLVPEWLEAPELGVRKPARIFRLDLLRFQEMGESWAEKYVLNDPIPKELIYGPISPELARDYGVEEEPDVIQKTGFGSGTLQ